MAVKGVFSSISGTQGDRRDSFASSLIRVMPTGTAQLLALSSGMETEDVSSVFVNWFEQNHITGRQKLTAAVADGVATSFTVDDASSYVAGTILLVETTAEYVLITGVSGNILTVVRGFAGTTGAAIAQNTYVQRLGTAFEEGSNRPVAVANSGDPLVNYMQIFRNTWNVTGSARALAFNTGDVVARNRKDCATFHAEDIERSLIWGRRSMGTVNGQRRSTMNGINSLIKTNVSAMGATTDVSDLESKLEPVFAKNIQGEPNERIAFAGNKTVSVLNQIARLSSQINISVGETSFGLRIFNWITPFGEIKLMTHPLMVESPFFTNALYVYHPAAIKVCYMRRTSTDDNDKNGSRSGVDADFGVLTTEASVKYVAEGTGAVLTGFTEGVAE